MPNERQTDAMVRRRFSALGASIDSSFRPEQATFEDQGSEAPRASAPR